MIKKSVSPQDQAVILLEDKIKRPINLLKYHHIHGGCINKTGIIETSVGFYFIKWNSAFLYKNMFKDEANGLVTIKETNSVRVPDIITFGEIEDKTFLILECIKSEAPGSKFWQNFGYQVAKLHQSKNREFGLEYDNYIGSLKQYNTANITWPDFFIQQRLEPQIKLASDNRKIPNNISKKFAALFPILKSVFPDEAPSLLHGDLWNGNFMVTHNREPVLIDPAIYYGNREMDIAMSKLFGGFDNKFYQAYQEIFPLEKGWEKRLEICNLYPLLVHVNLFGGGYINQVDSILDKYM